jgi:hypothetical protein
VECRFNPTFDADEGGGEIVEEDEHLGAISKRRGRGGSRATKGDGVSEGKGESESDLQPCTATQNLCTAIRDPCDVFPEYAQTLRET